MADNGTDARLDVPLWLGSLLIGAAGVLLLTLRTFETQLAIPGLPDWDASKFLLRAARIARDPAAVAAPDLHGPLHPTLLAAWLGLTGETLEAARRFGTLMTLCCAGSIAGLGARLRSWPAGVAAASLYLVGAETIRLGTSTMSEPTSALFVVLTVLAAAWPVQDGDHPVSDWLTGVFLLLATLTRWSNLPWLLLSLIVWKRGFRAGWIAPTTVVLGGWLLAKPALAGQIAAFLANRSSDLGLLDHLLFVPRGLVTDGLGLVGLAVLLGLVGAAIATVRPWDRDIVTAETDRRMQLVLWTFAVGALLVTLHPYKPVRQLYPLVPLAALGAVLPLRWHLPDQARALGLFAGFVLLLLGRPSTGTLPFTAHRPTAEILEFLEEGFAGQDVPWIWVVGTSNRLSAPLIAWTLRDTAPVREWAPPATAAGREPPDPRRDPVYAERTAKVLGAGAAVVSLQPRHDSVYDDPWTRYQRNYSSAISALASQHAEHRDARRTIAVRIYLPVTRPR